MILNADIWANCSKKPADCWVDRGIVCDRFCEAVAVQIRILEMFC